MVKYLGPIDNYQGLKRDLKLRNGVENRIGVEVIEYKVTDVDSVYSPNSFKSSIILYLTLVSKATDNYN